MANILKMGPSPHIRTKETVEDVMYDVIIALIPAMIAAWYFFGVRALTVTAVSILTCMVFEYICQKVMKRDIDVFDGSAIITGILYAFVIPANMSLTYVIIGAAVSIVLGKMVFGGLGHNIFNPALVGRAFIQASWPVAITTFLYDDIAGPTLLDAMKRGLTSDLALVEKGNLYMNTFVGRMGGSLGETSALALLIGGAYLIYKKQIDWKVPAIVIGTVFVATLASGADPVLHIFSGGLFLGAFFMATDMVTTPQNSKGRMVFALGLGILISLIRLKGGYPEGTAFAILIMNGFVPIINRYTKPKVFGEVKADAKK
ncbi:MAG: RnfABCDGE type electron transport complex subunit D [Cetobacterium sp.]|uniref:RnfABCDGE type electron transport complex subunit D n=1 Tax=unclassified Cetobacterium TaxID=2630983 RepID=UPI00163CE2E7|nr:RnfABCDGE type electron transport complex subunit D [Cetobacterium sp. 2A]MBC2856235.1 RnfABCDGE type electron transport complex subunit D [Cetobacterium sp. 2A]